MSNQYPGNGDPSQYNPQGQQYGQADFGQQQYQQQNYLPAQQHNQPATHGYASPMQGNESAPQKLSYRQGFSFALNGNQPGEKSRVIAALYASFLGWFGVHNFYLGYTKAGLIQLGITVVLALFMLFPPVGVLLAVVRGVWVMFDLLMIVMKVGPYMTDANGRSLS